jgi:hypothetical protein
MIVNISIGYVKSLYICKLATVAYGRDRSLSNGLSPQSNIYCSVSTYQPNFLTGLTADQVTFQPTLTDNQPDSLVRRGVEVQ